jgi:hypothetical protein
MSVLEFRGLTKRYGSVTAVDDLTFAPAEGRVIAKFLGTKQIDYTVPSLTGLGDRHFETPKDLEYEVSNARIWGGIHFRSAVEDGAEIGKQVAEHVLDHNFHKSDD